MAEKKSAKPGARARKPGGVVVEAHVRARGWPGAVVVDTAGVDLVDVPGVPGGDDEVICQLVVVDVERALEVLRRGRVRPRVVVLVVEHDRRRGRPCRAVNAKRDVRRSHARRAGALRRRRRPGGADDGRGQQQRSNPCAQQRQALARTAHSLPPRSVVGRRSSGAQLPGFSSFRQEKKVCRYMSSK